VQKEVVWDIVLVLNLASESSKHLRIVHIQQHISAQAFKLETFGLHPLVSHSLQATFSILRGLIVVSEELELVSIHIHQLQFS